LKHTGVEGQGDPELWAAVIILLEIITWQARQLRLEKAGISMPLAGKLGARPW